MKGTGYTDHCPNCLTGKHVDNNPGDRGSGCGSLMFPIAAHYKDGNFIIRYECSGCGIIKNIKCAPGDNRERLFELSAASEKISRKQHPRAL